MEMRVGQASEVPLRGLLAESRGDSSSSKEGEKYVCVCARARVRVLPMGVPHSSPISSEQHQDSFDPTS